MILATHIAFIVYFQVYSIKLDIESLVCYYLAQDKAQEKFMRIKHAYNTLLNSKARRKYDSEYRGSDSSYYSSRSTQSGNTQAEEEFYGLGKSSMHL